MSEFHRFEKLYYLFIVFLNWQPAIDTFGKDVSVIPAILVLIITSVKELFEVLQRLESILLLMYGVQGHEERERKKSHSLSVNRAGVQEEDLGAAARNSKPLYACRSQGVRPSQLCLPQLNCICTIKYAPL